ncbi:penicillin-binding protein 2 [bacterium]|nr:penicillin-binding protein 2 [bacterium]
MSQEWRSRFASRRDMFLIGGGLALGGLTARLAELQLFRGAEFAELAEENRIRLDPAPPHRGIVYDRRGETLATNKRNFYVTLTPELVGDGQKRKWTVEQLVRVISRADRQPLDEGQRTFWESRMRRIEQEAGRQAGFVEILVADDLTWEDYARVSVLAPELPGVNAKVGELRAYPFGDAFAHTVGYAARANDADIQRLIDDALIDANAPAESPAGKRIGSALRRLYKHPQMRLGKLGVEAFAERQLRGEVGQERVLVNANGRVIDRLPSDDVAGRPGADLVLSLDAELQRAAIERFGAEAGSCVVIDIPSGDIVAMVSTPAFDPNKFVSGISSADYSELLNNERKPLYHKAYEGTYPPGSTFKMVVGAAAMESGKATPEDRVYCSGRVWFGNRFFHCWRPEGHGSVNLHTALQKSCDVYFYEMARRIGVDAIADAARKFGLGHLYDIGITGGAVGVVPDTEWKRRVRNEAWFDGETLSVGIGQGYMSTTPFQLAVMAARIAAGSAAADPRLILSGARVESQQTAELRDISEDTMQRIRAGMYAVTSEAGGTALRAGELDPKGELPAPFTRARLAGKTGTAQVRYISVQERARGVIANSDLEWRLRDHALFVAFAPTDNPRYACAVVVDHGGSGSQVASPVARDILAMTLKLHPAGKAAFQPNGDLADAGGPTPTRSAGASGVTPT